VEKLPVSGDSGTTALPGVRIVGDLTGIPLLKFSSRSGAEAVGAVLAEEGFASERGSNPEVLDLAIIGAGVSGISAAIEAKKAGLRFEVFEATQTFATVANFPKGKPIYTYPTELTLDAGLTFSADRKEELLIEMEEQRAAAEIAVTPARIERLERKDALLVLHHADQTTTRALRVIVAIGRSGNHRKLGVRVKISRRFTIACTTQGSSPA
jgi:thioredoxin reductase